MIYKVKRFSRTEIEQRGFSRTFRAMYNTAHGIPTKMDKVIVDSLKKKESLSEAIKKVTTRTPGQNLVDSGLNAAEFISTSPTVAGVHALNGAGTAALYAANPVAGAAYASSPVGLGWALTPEAIKIDNKFRKTKLGKRIVGKFKKVKSSPTSFRIKNGIDGAFKVLPGYVG